MPSCLRSPCPGLPRLLPAAFPAGLPAAVLLLAAACADAPPGVESPVGVATEVELLGDGFVRFEGQRVPVDDFLFTMRERVRAAAGRAAVLPAVLVVVDADRGLPPSELEHLTVQLGAAGVRHVTLGGR